MPERAEAARWRTRGEFDAELHHLPRSSAAEFRTAAWKLWSHETLWPTNGWYLPAVGLRGLLAVVLALVPVAYIWALATGLRIPAAEAVFAVACTALSALLGYWKLRSNRALIRRRRRNGQLAEMSREIDDLVVHGVIPHAPPDWTGTVPSPLE